MSKLEQLLKLVDLMGGDEKTTSTDSPFKVGENYHIRTVTMAIAGTVKSVDDKFIVMSNASWVADTGRFNIYLKDTSNVSENEPFKHDVIVGIGAIVDATKISTVYTSVK